MLEQECYELRDAHEVRSLIERFGWATLVSAPPAGGPVVSHVPLLLDPAPGEVAAAAADRAVAGEEGTAAATGSAVSLSVLGHVARADAGMHGLGVNPSVLVVQGPNGYVSPAWYGAGSWVPTWNYVVVHLHGTCELLGEEETLTLLERTVAHYEQRNGTSWSLSGSTSYARRLVRQVTGFRLRPERVVAKAKLSQDKPAVVVAGVAAALEGSPDEQSRHLGATMRRALAAGDHGRSGG